ncbi:SAM-dependent methyltransferase [Pelovirga terrestris]|uniref:Class I SAM-dependent methyltransferase n=1 Tax=Pelovirga terrestris TaxID=2771352 RepID=A0A8J6QZ43_9BACT|nr:cyclopropane-fatty-acyl-phospholipid synthase family protein [Pelovirga terrestris]MBD1401823.1 class I SAM-dependent methyltransferase [Pelovirga terrestris]
MISSTLNSRFVVGRNSAATRVQAWSRSLLHRLLQHLYYGQITLIEGDHQVTFGQDADFHAQIQVNDPAFYPKAVFGGSIGAGESYIDGDWDADCLTTLVRIVARNSQLLDRLEDRWAWLVRPWQRAKHLLRCNNRSGSKKNILAHYDLGNSMYESFLDPTMMYSAAIYPNVESRLEDAAVYKLEHICRRLDLRPEDRVIEIGSGWGGFAIHAASHYGCHVTTTTISDAQYQEAHRRIAAAGLEDRITLLKQDYRDLEGTYDKLVSIEMIEAVGHRYLPQFFAQCNRLLKPDGMMLLQAITIQDQLYQRYLTSVDFIQEHIFPGGCLLSNHHLLKLMSEKTDMVVRGIEDFGLDYARTLKDWYDRFIANFNKIEQKGFDERFKRLWSYYFCYCEGGFRERAISVVQLTATRPGHLQPLSRS